MLVGFTLGGLGPKNNKFTFRNACLLFIQGYRVCGCIVGYIIGHLILLLYTFSPRL